MSLKKGKGRKRCKRYGEYQWMMENEMDKRGPKGDKHRKRYHKCKKKNRNYNGYYYEYLEHCHKGRGKRRK
ncbi:hypothetical protein LCL96_18540 [Rossellomorea aquimaris]|uniref:hypothetical protein n=1 Tax=Rossellomorea aquimaris TaxID=189382 RepID=UPI001CD732D1|nr:hypothetical protein [Rossellomorea aquimaris]MCA1060918.1 hypothetical protein [Rossellomorea aquimaris]